MSECCLSGWFLFRLSSFFFWLVIRFVKWFECLKISSFILSLCVFFFQFKIINIMVRMMMMIMIMMMTVKIYQKYTIFKLKIKQKIFLFFKNNLDNKNFREFPKYIVSLNKDKRNQWCNVSGKQINYCYSVQKKNRLMIFSPESIRDHYFFC